MMYKRLLAALLFFIYATALGATPLVVKDDYGGKVVDYNARWKQYEGSKEDIVIDGSCVSACARFMTLTKACATPQAYFYLHGITYGDGKVDREAGVADSRQWESRAAFALQSKYNAFAFGYEENPSKVVLEKETGVWVVYFQLTNHTTYQKFLKVKATLLIPACTPKTILASTQGHI